jgi:hypothetical protein
MGVGDPFRETHAQHGGVYGPIGDDRILDTDWGKGRLAECGV